MAVKSASRCLPVPPGASWSLLEPQHGPSVGPVLQAPGPRLSQFTLRLALVVLSSAPCVAALKIHLSSATKEVLDEFGYFDLQLRGDVEMKVSTLDVCVLIVQACRLPDQQEKHLVPNDSSSTVETVTMY